MISEERERERKKERKKEEEREKKERKKAGWGKQERGGERLFNKSTRAVFVFVLLLFGASPCACALEGEKFVEGLN